MVKILYKDPLVCASNNGFWSEFFKLTQATRQGCCYSPGIFVLVVELLGLGIRQNERIEGITINGQEIKSGQFADDLWTSLKASERNLQNTLNEIQDFGRMSGLYTNPEKCAILKIGPHRNSEAKYYSMRRAVLVPKVTKNIRNIYLSRGRGHVSQQLFGYPAKGRSYFEFMEM